MELSPFDVWIPKKAARWIHRFHLFQLFTPPAPPDITVWFSSIIRARMNKLPEWFRACYSKFILNSYIFTYCLSKHSCPFLCSNSIYKNLLYLDIMMFLNISRAPMNYRDGCEHGCRETHEHHLVLHVAVVVQQVR